MVANMLSAVSDDPMTATATKLPDRWTLKTSQMPMMFRFSDTRNYNTVSEVDPKHFADSYGPGARVISVKLEQTDDPIVFGKIRRELPWLNAQPTSILAPYNPHNRLVWYMNSSTFVLGEDEKSVPH